MYRIRSLKNVPSKCARLNNGFVNYSSKNNSDSTKSQSFIGRFVDNIRDELAKNKEMKESLKNFRAETEKIEQSETLKAARQKFVEFEKEAARNSDVFKDRILSIRDRFQEVFTEASKTDLARKAGKISEDITKTVSQTSQQIGKSSAFQTISQVTSAVKKEIDSEVVEGKVYEQPKKLRKRKEIDDSQTIDYSKIKADDQTTHIDLTKESKFSESWQRFKATNPYVQQVFEWKIRYDESSNPMIRVSRALTDRLTTLTSGLFEKNDLSKVLTELCQIDPQFDAQKFLAECEQDFIPNILEAMAQHDLEILRDWCYEGPYNIFKYQSEQLRAQKHRMHTQILDIDNVDIVTGRTVDDHGPVLILSFQAQMISYIEDFNGNIIEGSTDKVYRANYVWAMCRDPNELDPKAAWKLLECSMQMMQQLI